MWNVTDLLHYVLFGFFIYLVCIFSVEVTYANGMNVKDTDREDASEMSR